MSCPVADVLPRLSAAAEGRIADFRVVLREALDGGGRAGREPALRIAAERCSDDALVALLRDPADDVLRNAALEMLVLKGARAVPLLIGLLGDRDADVVLHAVQTLGRIRDVRALGPVVSVLRHANVNVVQAAILALGRMGHRAAAPLVEPFLEGDLWLRAAAAEALGDLRQDDSVAPLASQLDDPVIGPLAAEALARIGGVRAFEVLAAQWLTITGWSEPHLELLAHVLEGLDEPVTPPSGLRHALTVTLSHPAGEPRVAAARCLLALGAGEGDGEALAALAGPTADGAVLPACLHRRADLVGALLERDGAARGWGLGLAARHPWAVPARVIERAVEDANSSQLPALVQALLAVAEPRLAAALVRLYGRLPSDGRRLLIPVVRLYRAWLQEALAQTAGLPAEARRVLAAAVADEGAAALLAELDDRERVEALEHLADQPQVLERLPWVDWLAVNPAAYAPLAAQFADRAGLRLALPEVRRLLERQPQADLVRLVASLRDPDSVPVLEALVRGDDAALVPGAITALGAIGGDRARSVLRGLLGASGPWVRFAWRALAECRDATDLDLFHAALAHDDWHVRMVAVTVLSVARRPADRPALALATADPVRAVADRARSYLLR